MSRCLCLQGFRIPALSGTCLSLAVSAYLVLCTNTAFWKSVGAAVSPVWENLPLYAAIGTVMTAAYALCLALLPGLAGRMAMAAMIVVAGGSSYFMDTYGVHIDRTMLVNVLLTDRQESAAFFSSALFGQLTLRIVLPCLAVLLVPVKKAPFRRELARRLRFSLLCLVVGAGTFGMQYREIVSFFRVHEGSRTLLNPASTLNAAALLVRDRMGERTLVLQPVGQDAKLMPHRGRPRLVVLVLGETARAQNWGLNGYGRETTPRLRERNVINFPEVTSCGTSTAVSVPCMFSPFPRSEYSDAKGKSHENLLDVLNRAGVKVIWRDNDTGGSQKVTARVGEERLEDARDPAWCSGDGCLDDILLKDLDARLAQAGEDRDVLLVLHQKGSHGPAYFQRYPEGFGTFTPECRVPDLQQCPKESIVNAYDNTILYTDAFLDRVADRLGRLGGRYDACMLYLSDHGESLGEYGLYLHGIPYAFAPEVQTHVPMIMWFGKGAAAGFGVDEAMLRENALKPYSHDNLFHSLLGLMGVQTSAYEQGRDIFAPCRTAS